MEDRNAAAATSAPSVTAATTHARCQRARGGSRRRSRGRRSPRQRPTRVGTVTGEGAGRRPHCGHPRSSPSTSTRSTPTPTTSSARPAGCRSASRRSRCGAAPCSTRPRPPRLRRRHGVCRAGGGLVGDAGVRDVFVAYPSVDVEALRERRDRPRPAPRGHGHGRLRRARALPARHARRRRRRPRGGARRGRLAAAGPGAPRGAPLADPHAHAGPRRGARRRRGRARRARPDVLRRPGRRAAGCRAARAAAQAPLGARPASGAPRSSTRCAARWTCASSTPAAPGACTGSRATRSSPSSPPGRACTARRCSTATTTSRRAGDGLRAAGGAPTGARDVTAYGGGYVASGAPGWSRVPKPVRRGSVLVRTEARARCRPRCTAPTPTASHLGDRVWMRGAKAGELLERFTSVHLVSGDELVDASRPTAAREELRERPRGATGRATCVATPRRCARRHVEGVVDAVPGGARGLSVRVAGRPLLHPARRHRRAAAAPRRAERRHGGRPRAAAVRVLAGTRCTCSTRPSRRSGSPCPTSVTSTARRSAAPSPPAPTAPAPGSRASPPRSAG